jgi:glycolate oxidase subunit GlcD
MLHGHARDGRALLAATEVGETLAMVNPNRRPNRNDAALAVALRRVLPRRRILTDPGELSLYDTDGLSLHRATPGGVLLLESAAEVIGAMRACSAAGIPYVPRGAGTGLSGGAVPLDRAWLLDVTRMNRILEIDPLDRVARVEPGVVNLDLDRAAAAHGLRYAPDPSSQQACTIGGNIAENSGGPHCFRHGMTTRHVHSLEVVLPPGRCVTLGHRSGTTTGPDDRGLFVGSEGTLGVVVEATVALGPRPERVRTFLASFSSLGASCRAVSRIIASGARPAALEILDRFTIAAVEASVFRAGYPTDAEAVLLVEGEGSAAEIEEETRAVRDACEAEGSLRFEEAEDPEARARLWRGRKGAFGAMGRVARDLYVLDGVVPRRKLAEVIEAIGEIGRRHRLRLSNVFHAGDGNLHPNISFDSRDREESARVLAAGEEILRLCVAAGGTLSGEHGIGIEKRDHMSLVFSDEEIETQRQMRDAIDPDRLANPGKVFPGGRGCVEAGFRGAGHAERSDRILR